MQYARNDAGLCVRLVSNDHIETAKAIARRAGVLTRDEANEDTQDRDQAGRVMDGAAFSAAVGNIERAQAFEPVDASRNDCDYEELQYMDRFTEIAVNLRVLARATAEHKRKLVVGLKALRVTERIEAGELVDLPDDDARARKLHEMQTKISVTGDGVGDVDALKEAQVGLAMGTGCAAAKDASQLVITDNNFQGCLQAVLWGRNIYQNVTRYLQFQLTCNLALVLTVVVGMFFFGESPFSAAQLLWINTIMDVLGALALATEPPMRSSVKGNPGQ